MPFLDRRQFCWAIISCNGTRPARPRPRRPVAAGPVRARNCVAGFHSARKTQHSGLAAVRALGRRAVEATGGETSVVICGGPSLVSRVRNCVASLSDERAVHKGSGAQGIHIYAEEYSF